MNSEINKKVIGLDISDRKLRFIEVKKRGKKIQITKFDELDIPSNIVINGEIKESEKLSMLIEKITKKIHGNKKSLMNLVTVLPESKTFIKVIKIPHAAQDELQELIEEEIGKHIPMTIDEIYLDWQVLSEDESQITVLIGAAPKTIVDSYLLALENGKLEPVILEIEAAAIIRSLIEDPDNKTRVVLDFGAMRSSLILIDKGTVQFSVSLPISGTNITKTISQKLKIDLDKAEKAKIICGLDQAKCDGALLNILMESIDQLALHINKSINFYQSNHKDAGEISEVIICGGGANFKKIDKILSEKINLPVSIGNPLSSIIQHAKNTLPKNKTLSYTTAIGLGLRSIKKQKNSTLLNLLPPEKKHEINLKSTYIVIKNLIITILLYIIIAAIALLLAKFSLQNHFNNVVSQTTLTTRYGNLFNKDIKTFNKKLKDVEKIQSDYVAWSSFIFETTRLIPEDITIFSISADNKNSVILISGQSKTREQLLKLKDNLEASTIFSEVNVPLENLLNKQDLNFSIQAKINLKAEKI